MGASRRSWWCAFSLIAVLGHAAGASAQSIAPRIEARAVMPRARISAAVDNRQRVRLSGQVHRLARAEFDQGPASQDLPMQRILLLLRGTEEQEKALQQLLVDLHDRSSGQYHQWLTPEEFGARFGAHPQDIDKITAWLANHGMRVHSVANNRRMIEFSGTAAQVTAAFATEIHRFNVNGELHYANASAPSVPAALAPVVQGFVSLHDFRRRPSHRVVRAGQIDPLYNTSSGTHVLGPYDFAAIYNVTPLWNRGIDGTGQSIAIISRSNIWWSDLTWFGNFFSMPVGIPELVLNGDDPGVLDDGDVMEASADMEWAGAIAKHAKLKLVASKSTNSMDGIDLSALYAVDQNVAPIISLSYGSCELDPGMDFYGWLWEQAAAQGISVVVGSADSGSAACDWRPTPATRGFAVNGLASSPHNVAVGGTSFNENGNDNLYWNLTNDEHHASAKGYIPETTWNESSTTGLWASGGGVSALYDAPLWQTGAGVPTDDPGAPGQHHRYMPDVAFSAARHDAYFVCAESDCSFLGADGVPHYYLVYGTSLSAPAFAGIMALVNQQMGSNQGNPNFYLYPLATTPGVFHDITTGNNAVPCTAGTGCANGMMSGYNAGPGYDLATGLGSVDANALVSNWGNVSFRSATVDGSATPAAFQHGGSVSYTVNVTATSGNPSGSVEAYVTNGGKTTVLDVLKLANGTAGGSTNATPGGSSTLYFRYNGDGIYGRSTSTGIPLSVSPEPTTMALAGPTGEVTPGASFNLNAAISGSSGVGVPTGNVTVSGPSGTPAGGGGWLGPDGTTSLYVFYTPPAPGTVQFSARYEGDSSFAPSSGTVTITYGKFDTWVSFGCENGNRDVVAGFPIGCRATVTGYYGPGVTGSVQFYDNDKAVGAPVPLVRGDAVITLTGLAVGSHAISASYSGDDNYRSRNTTLSAAFSVLATGTIRANAYANYQSVRPGGGLNISGVVETGQYGPNLTGTVTLLDGSTVVGTYTAPGTTNYISPVFYLNTPANPLSLGTHSFTVSYAGDSLWPAGTSTPASVLVANPDFSIALPTSPVTLNAGRTTTFYLNVKGIAGLYGPLTITCSGMPAESTCTTDGGWIESTPLVTIKTTAPVWAGMRRRDFSGLIYLALLPVAGLLLLRRTKLNGALALLATIALLVSCGGGGSSSGSGSYTKKLVDPGTPPGTYTVTITGTYSGTEGTITHSYPFTLVVKSFNAD